MDEKAGIRFRPTLTGGMFLVLPLLLLRNGIGGTPLPVLVLALGLPVLGCLSLVFLLASALPVYRKFRTSAGSIGILPGRFEGTAPLLLKTDPPRPSFLPGLRLSALWSLRFGPFRRAILVALPPSGAGRGEVASLRRGMWNGTFTLRLRDPFAFFILDFRKDGQSLLVRPPAPVDSGILATFGNPASDAVSSPRYREDADERHERREYRQGDDTRHLDWKQLARTGEMMLRIGEDGIPDRGRVRIAVLSPFSSTKGEVRRLDSCLHSAMFLAQGFSKAGIEALVRLPGEESWLSVETGDWELRLAGSLPVPGTPGDWPGIGEKLWLICSSWSLSVLDSAEEARSAGCEVSLCIPGEIPEEGQSRFSLFLTTGSKPILRRFIVRKMTEFRQVRFERTAAKRGLDVRRI